MRTLLFDLVLALGLTMDTFAASLVLGAADRPARRVAIGRALLLGVVQAGAPLLGWVVGREGAELAADLSRWIAATILAVVGGKMAWEGLRGGEEHQAPRGTSGLALVGTAAATSVDALSVGVGLGLIGGLTAQTVVVLGVMTVVVSFAGQTLGARLGERFGRWALLAGGGLLVGLAGKALVA